jgi:hypothetical protein
MSEGQMLVIGTAALILGSVLGLKAFYLDRGWVRLPLMAMGIAVFLAGRILLRRVAGY